tara:strand:+ start:999 stop:1256 length:258 start_codon:yes stop_codon:yes gene_type:complete
MNYLQTLDINLVNDMIGVEVENIRTIEQTRLNYKNLNNEFKSAFTNYLSHFYTYKTDEEEIEYLMNIMDNDYQLKAEFYELNSIE